MNPAITPDIIAGAQACQRRYFVPAAVSIAQWALESAWGKSMPPGSNNPFGIKWNGTGDYVSSMTWEVVNGANVRIEQRFAKYASFAEAFEAHARLLATVSLYKPAMDAWYKGHDLVGGIKLMAQHYATDPQYASKIISIINDNALAALDSLPEDQPGAVAPKPVTAGGPVPAPAPQDPLSQIISSISDTIGSVTQPTPSGTSAASASPFDPTSIEVSIMESILIDLLEGLGGKIGAASSVVAFVPTLVEGTIKNVAELPKAEAAVAALVADIKGGKWSDVPNALEAILAEVTVLVGNYGLNLSALNAMVKTMGSATAVVAQTASVVAASPAVKPAA